MTLDLDIESVSGIKEILELVENYNFIELLISKNRSSLEIKKDDIFFKVKEKNNGGGLIDEVLEIKNEKAGVSDEKIVEKNEFKNNKDRVVIKSQLVGWFDLAFVYVDDEGNILDLKKEDDFFIQKQRKIKKGDIISKGGIIGKIIRLNDEKLTEDIIAPYNCKILIIHRGKKKKQKYGRPVEYGAPLITIQFQ